MSRRHIFDREEVEGIRGLTSLTEPDEDDDVGAIIDVPVIGARGDGKTQFIVHAIRTLRAYAPVLDGTEQQYNRDVLQVVLNAREPRPDATIPGVVPHYVFRIRPEVLLSQVGFSGRLSLLARAARLSSYLMLAVVNAAALFAVLVWLQQAITAAAIVGSVAALVVAFGLSWVFAQRRFREAGDLEIVFWDVAGEHVYSDSAADYYAFLSALVRERHKHAQAGRTYSFAPILVCNPLSLGTKAEGSAYARLRQLIPLFASLNGPNPRVLVAINRYSVVEHICKADSDRKEVVALFSQRRNEDKDLADPNHDDNAATHRLEASESMPVVVRDVVRAHCLDAEDANDDGVYFAYLRYDAGIECEFVESDWKSYDELPEPARLRWRAPTSAMPERTLEYHFEEGPGSFQGSTRRDFLLWLSRTSFASDHAVRAPVGKAPKIAVPPEDSSAPEPGTPKADDSQPMPSMAPVHEPEVATATAQDTSAWAPNHRASLHSLSGAFDLRRQADESEDKIWSGPSEDFRDEGTEPGVGPAEDRPASGGFRGGT